VAAGEGKVVLFMVSSAQMPISKPAPNKGGMTFINRPDQSKARALTAGLATTVVVMGELEDAAAAAALEALRASLASRGLWKTALTMVNSW
jgi:hypothetical protein